MVSLRDSEWVTRKRLTDKVLRGAGWRIAPLDPLTSLDALEACAVEEYQSSNGPADFALVVGGRVRV